MAVITTHQKQANTTEAHSLVRHGIWTCTATHQRHHIKAHHFTNNLFWFGIDLNNLPTLPKLPGVFGVNTRSWTTFRDSDFFPTPHQGSVSSRVLHWLSEQSNVSLPDLNGFNVMLLGQLRTANYVFNPIALYIVTNPHNQPVCAVAEVTNTFYERKAYMLPLTDWQAELHQATFAARMPKHFYVSPFLDLDLTFDFQLTLSPERFTLTVNSLDAKGNPHIHTRLTGCYQPLTQSSLLRHLLRLPLLPQQMITAIHGQAFRLWLKKIPYRKKHHNPQWQTHRLVSRFP